MSKDKGVLKRAIVTPDKHAPLHDKAAINVVKKAIEIIKTDIYIDLRDLGEWGSVSHWQWKRKKMTPLEYIIPRIDKLLNYIRIAQLDASGQRDRDYEYITEMKTKIVRGRHPLKRNDLELCNELYEKYKNDSV